MEDKSEVPQLKHVIGKILFNLHVFILKALCGQDILINIYVQPILKAVIHTY